MEYKGIYIIVRRDAETQRREAAPLGTDKREDFMSSSLCVSASLRTDKKNTSLRTDKI
jgi:hypothetical protein